MIAAVGQNRELGKQGKVVWSFREDLDFYLEQTRGKKLLVGKKTFDGLDTFPTGTTIYVLNEEAFDAAAKRKSDWGKEHTFVVTDLEKVINEYEFSDEELIVIGGAGVYAQVLPHASKLLITEIQATDSSADAFFPNINEALYNRIPLGQGTVQEGDHQGLAYEFAEYDRIAQDRNDSKSA